MSFTPLANGDTNYVSKINGNFATADSRLTGVENVLAGATGGAGSNGALYQALFGSSVAVIGASSYECTGSGSTLTVEAGYVWVPSLGKVLQHATSSTLDFTGQAAGTYYITADPTGAPVRNPAIVADAIYSVVWTGSAFGTITLLAAIVGGTSDGALARTWQTGRLSLSVAGSADVTLTAIQANNAVLNFTGALTGDISVIVPLGTNPREWIATNNTTGAHTLTVKGATGTGIVVAQGGFSNLYQDGTNVLAVSGSGAGFGTVTSVGVSVPTFLSATGAITTAGTIAITLSGTALPVANGGTGGTSASAARTALGLAIGTDVQGHSAALDAVAGTNTGDETAATIATIEHAASTKSAMVDADEATLLDSAASFALKRFTFTNLKAFLKTYFDTLYGSGSGSVTTVSVTTANGVSGSVATATSTPAITLTLGAITPTTVNGVTVSGSSTPTLAVTGTTTVSGANTGDETGARVATLLHAASNKTTLVDADEVNGTDSASSFSLIRTTWTNVKVFLKTYFDTLYAPNRDTVTALSISSGVVDIDCSLGDYFTLALSANVTSFTFSNLPGSGKGFSKWIEITQNASAAKTVTLSGFKWAGGIGTTAVSTALSAIDELALTSVDNGTTVKATLGKAFA